jgi:pimeloyl-ACP methyl ester carboxylesterase
MATWVTLVGSLLLAAASGCSDGAVTPNPAPGPDGGSTGADTGTVDAAEESLSDAPEAGSPFPPALIDQPVQWEPCVLDDNKGEGEAECADVRVPLLWSDPSGETIPLHLKRKRGAGTPRRQLWMLDGGPGGAGTTTYGRYMELLAGQDPDLEILTLDHRGTGLSNRLGCPDQEDGASEWGIFLSDAEWPVCLADLEARDVRLDAYTTTQAAWDTAFLLELLGREGTPRFVYGSSYGTYLAHRFAQIFPLAATGVILDSICPSESCRLDRQDELANDVVREILELCGQDAFCASKMGPDPWQRAWDVLEKMRDGHCSAFTSMGLTPSHIQQMPFVLAQRWGSRPLVPAIYYRMDRCDPGDVAFLKNLTLAYMATDVSSNAPIFYRRFSHIVSRNITFSELVSEELPSLEEANALDESLLATSHNGVRLLAAIASWPRYERDSYYHAWASKDVPILMLNGTLDTATPMAIAVESREHLNGSAQRFFEIPWGAHGVIGQSPVTDPEEMPCGMQILLSYVHDPEVVPDTSCLGELLAVDFAGYGDRFGVETALGTSDLWENEAGTTSLPAVPRGALRVLDVVVGP